MKITNFSLVVGAALLTGCSTPSQLRQGQPEFELRSNKTAKDVAMCIADQWENGTSGFLLTAPPITMRPTQTGYMIALRNGSSGATQMLVDVEPAGSGSVSRYYKGVVLGIGRYEDAIKSCQM